MSKVNKTIKNNSRMVSDTYKKILNKWKNREYN